MPDDIGDVTEVYSAYRAGAAAVVGVYYVLNLSFTTVAALDRFKDTVDQGHAGSGLVDDRRVVHGDGDGGGMWFENAAFFYPSLSL